MDDSSTLQLTEKFGILMKKVGWGKKMKRCLDIIAIVCLIVIMLTGCMDGTSSESSVVSHAKAASDATITKEEYNQLKTGMSYSEVVKIVGGEGTLISKNGEENEEFYTCMYQWPGEGSGASSANVIFQSDKLLSKSEYGLV